MVLRAWGMDLVADAAAARFAQVGRAVARVTDRRTARGVGAECSGAVHRGFGAARGVDRARRGVEFVGRKLGGRAEVGTELGGFARKGDLRGARRVCAALLDVEGKY